MKYPYAKPQTRLKMMGKCTGIKVTLIEFHCQFKPYSGFKRISSRC